MGFNVLISTELSRWVSMIPIKSYLQTEFYHLIRETYKILLFIDMLCAQILFRFQEQKLEVQCSGLGFFSLLPLLKIV